ncbi:hypothetical protein [Campylobacter vulpis]|uniref:hypothetical protein n=1 Tax=Campylobacter vulpis TaxID=1655500 RepID=UPI001BD1B388|nr:hypothetical protein [Campylobacter vulpis]MBS4407343.1 hypothetical protein [Campylobacter vulpis]
MTNDTFEKTLLDLNLSKKDFANLANIPYQTLMNWKAKNQTPSWVKPFLSFYEKSKDLDALLKLLSKYH